MATLTIKNLPDEIYSQLAKTAKRNRRSINNEAIVRLERTLEAEQDNVEETIERFRKLRDQTPNARLTGEDVNLAKNEGRP